MSARAREVFTNSLLELMEKAFEGGDFGYGKLNQGTSRLRAIYQNLIDNKGQRFTRYRDSKRVVYDMAALEAVAAAEKEAATATW
jgi:hypothetical protein